ncbi:hypothetical protein HK414_16055 [Ramlibacter terrae]|uniref:Calcium-binding protein n=1 Tax=Ramlibacter terrae TaxID=2732511 RepID=A0ABX6P3L3_9BURK|nr:hypothetical protein HK414_16055 [Ramlibacter terrae]
MRAEAGVTLGIGDIGITAQATPEINTSNERELVGVQAGRDFRLGLVGTMNMLALKVDLDAAISTDDDVFELRLNNASVNFFNSNLIELRVSGYIRSDGEFEIKGHAGFNLDMGPLKLSAGLDVLVSDDEFAVSFEGALRLVIDFGLFEIDETPAGFSGSIRITPVSADLAASVTIAGITASGSFQWRWGPKPQISHVENGVLKLHMGDDDNRYGDSQYKDTKNEFYTVSKEKIDDVEYITVRSLGEVERYRASDIHTIEASGGSGNDSIMIMPGIQAKLVLDGGEGNDNFVIGDGFATSVVLGGAGDDKFTGGLGHGIKYRGGAGNDSFVGGNADEDIEMGSGDDTVHAGGGNDTIRVDSGTDWVDAGSGDDLLLVGNVGNLTLLAGGGTDRLVMDSFTSTGAIRLGAHKLVAGARTVSFDDALERFEMRDLTTGTTTITTDDGHDWGSTDLAITSRGTVDVTGAEFKAAGGMLALHAAGLTGTLNTELEALSVVVTGSGATANIRVVEANDLNIVRDVHDDGLGTNTDAVTDGLSTNSGLIQCS